MGNFVFFVRISGIQELLGSVPAPQDSQINSKKFGFECNNLTGGIYALEVSSQS